MQPLPSSSTTSDRNRGNINGPVGGFSGPPGGLGAGPITVKSGG